MPIDRRRSPTENRGLDICGATTEAECKGDDTGIEERGCQTPQYPDLPGKVVVVTGGSRGIGAATARTFAKNHAAVVVVGRDQTAIESTVHTITISGACAIGVAADCTVEGGLARLRQIVNDRFGAADILATFAGGNGIPVPTLTETATHWWQVIESDLTSTFLTPSAFLGDMTARHTGAIITMSSAAARLPAQSCGVYVAAKEGGDALHAAPRKGSRDRRHSG